MNRPYIICHMVMSIDGKVTGDFLYREACYTATEEYYRLNRELPAQAFACGRVTMEGSFTGGWYPNLNGFEVGLPGQNGGLSGLENGNAELAGNVSGPENGNVGLADYIAETKATRYAVAFDRQGRLGWKTSQIEDEDPGYGGAHIIEVLCENVSHAYLAYLRSIGVSYIFAGKKEMNLELALSKLQSKFGINTLLLEGGSVINGAFERAGLVDELSLVQVPVIAGADSKPHFDDSEICGYAVKNTVPLAGGAQWLRFVKKQEK